jgi:hypothetical protein
MELQNLKSMVEGLSNGGEMSVELYTDAEVMCGRLICPVGSRLSDLLNDSSSNKQGTKTTFLEFVPMPRPDDLESSENELREYISKSAIDLMTVSDSNVGRGTENIHSRNIPMFRKKSTVRIIVQLLTYTLIGNIHCSLGQTVNDVLNDDAQFIPMTNVTMARDALIYGTRPFVAVNRDKIISCWER